MNKNEPLHLVPKESIPIAQDVPTDDLMSIFRLAAKMEKVCVDGQGIGLSAVQVGIPWKFFIVQKGRQFEYYVNCVYEGIGDKQKSIEGCLSLRNADGTLKRYEVLRFEKIKIKGKQLKFSNSPSLILEDVNRTETGLYAVVFQHEIDHSFNIFISDFGKEIELSQ